MIARFVAASVLLITCCGFQNPIEAMVRPPMVGISGQGETHSQTQQASSNQTNTQKSATPKSKGAPEPEDREQPIRIVSAPPITISRYPAPIDIRIPRDWPTLGVSILLALIGLVGAIIAIHSLRRIREQTEIARDAANAAKSASDTANGTAEKMKDAAERELRAYVGPSAATIKCIVEGKFFAAVEIRNFGRTPAYKVRNFIDHRVCPFRTAATEFSDPHPLIQYAEGTLFPNNPFYATEEIEINSLESDDHIFIYGKIEYEDVFKNEQWTSYKFVFPRPNTAVTPIVGQTYPLTIALDGNETEATRKSN